MTDLGKDTNKLFEDLLSLLARYSIVGWNILMDILIGLKLMPIFKRYPKLLILLVLVLMCMTAPIALVWVLIAIAALNNDVKASNDFKIIFEDKTE